MKLVISYGVYTNNYMLSYAADICCVERRQGTCTGCVVCCAPGGVCVCAVFVRGRDIEFVILPGLKTLFGVIVPGLVCEVDTSRNNRAIE